MKTKKLFGRRDAKQTTTAVATAPAVETGTDYATRFLKRRELKTRHSVYISGETHASITRLVHLLAITGREISIGGYIDNVVAEHLESHKEFFDEMRRQQLEQG